jgi:L-aspartate oxidase
MGDLAPRDVVAAAINARLAESGDPCVYLDARGVEDLERRFPTVTGACRAAGIDPTVQVIPVVPGAHYSCGGVVTDVHGRTEIAGLFAAGEVGRTGMHGANRLASNSLLEGLVVGGRAGREAAEHSVRAGIGRVAQIDLRDRITLPRHELQRAMSQHASVERDATGLGDLKAVLAAATDRPLSDRASFEDAALTVTAQAVAAAAADRAESRGCHHRSDHTATDPARAVSATVRWGPGRLSVEQPEAVVC